MIFSASRISLYIQCKRKWAWHYLLDAEQEKNDALDIGTETHKQLEDLIRLGKPVDMTVRSGVLASALEPYARPWILNPLAKAEGEFSFQGRHTWRGYKDLTVPGGFKDWKTSSNPALWAPTPEGLRHDPQALIYAKHHFLEHPQEVVATAEWLYVGKKKPHRVLPVLTTITRAHADLGFEVLERKADEALTLTVRSEADIMSVPGNFTATDRRACSAFGGCKHRFACGTLF